MPNKEKIKNIVFDAFKPTLITLGNKEIAAGIYSYKLEQLLNIQHKRKISETMQEINGEPYFLYICKPDGESSKIWEIQLIHVRKKVLPGEADEEGFYKDKIDLPDGRWPAESTTMAYYEDENQLYLQRNKYGISVRYLEEYFTGLMGEKARIGFNLVKGNQNISKISESALYRHVIVYADTEEVHVDEEKPSSLSSILRKGKDMGARYVKVQVSSGRSKKTPLTTQEVIDFVKEAYGYVGTKSLHVNLKDTEDVDFETIDVMTDKKSYMLKMPYSDVAPIRHEDIYRKFKEAHDA